MDALRGCSALAALLLVSCSPSVEENERAVSNALRALATVEADFRANDRDGNRIQDFWIGTLAGLHARVPRHGTPEINLILSELAAADEKRPDAVPYHGYFFKALENDEDGVPYSADGKSDRHPTKFGYCAYPAEPGGTGRSVFYINEGNTILRAPARRPPILTFPGSADIWDDAPPAPDLPLLQTKDADADLKRTRIVSDLDALHEPGVNLLWCIPMPPGPSNSPAPVASGGRFRRDVLFQNSFERYPEDFRFEGRPVHAFGVRPQGTRRNSCWQVVKHAYASSADFTVEIPSDAGERVLIARLPRGRTLRDTIASAIARTGPQGSLQPEDELRLPCLKVDLTKGIPSAPPLAIQFRLDESGAKKVANYGGYTTSEIALGAPVPPKKLICDGPFLVLLLRKGADLPYFAMWIENAELLCPK